MDGSVTDSMAAVFDFEARGEFEIPQKVNFLEGYQVWFKDSSRMDIGAKLMSTGRATASLLE